MKHRDEIYRFYITNFVQKETIFTKQEEIRGIRDTAPLDVHQARTPRAKQAC